MLKKYQHLPKWKSFQKVLSIDKQINQNNKNISNAREDTIGW